MKSYIQPIVTCIVSLEEDVLTLSATVQSFGEVWDLGNLGKD